MLQQFSILKISGLSFIRYFTGLMLFPGAVDALMALGWVQDEASPEELVVREGVYFSMKEVSSWRRHQHEKMQGVSFFVCVYVCVCVCV